MSVPTVTLNSLKDYSALPVLRESIAAKAPGLVIQGLELPAEMISLLLQVAESSQDNACKPFSCPVSHKYNATQDSSLILF
jgi:hypothetical protein